MRDEIDHYRQIVGHALAGFQLLEANLKDYIAQYHATVRSILPLELGYKHSATDIEDAALGKLIQIFERSNSNATLISTLRRLKSQRDHLAHRALIQLYGRAEETYPFDPSPDQLIELSEELGNLQKQVLEETLKLCILRNR